MRLISEQDLESALRAVAVEEPRIVASGNHASPRVLLAALERTLERYRLFMLAAHGPLPDRDGVIFETPFVGPGMRTAAERLDYLPMRLSLVPRLFATVRPPDVVLLHTSTPREGKVSLGIEVNILAAAVEHVRARGGPGRRPAEPADAVHLRRRGARRGRDRPRDRGGRRARLACRRRASTRTRSRSPSWSPVWSTTARHCSWGSARFPTRPCARSRARRDLAIWSEMISDGVMELDRGGALRLSAPIVCSFLFGSPELYDWVDGNPRLRMTRTETTNDPSRIAAHPGMISRQHARCRSTSTTRPVRATSTDASTPASAASLTSSSGRCTRPVVMR